MREYIENEGFNIFNIVINAVGDINLDVIISFEFNGNVLIIFKIRIPNKKLLFAKFSIRLSLPLIIAY